MIGTIWGYDVDLQTLPDLLTVSEYNVYTNNEYAGASAQVAQEISAASAAVRNFVGWHLYPSAPCVLETHMLDRRVTFIGSDLLIQLPARFVTGITSVTIGGTAFSSYYCDRNGLLRVYNAAAPGRICEVKVEYTAGISEDMMAPVKELIAHRVTHAVAVPAGITSEASGGVSVTYNANWINNSRATALAGDNKEILIPYKVQGVF